MFRCLRLAEPSAETRWHTAGRRLQPSSRLPEAPRRLTLSEPGRRARLQCRSQLGNGPVQRLVSWWLSFYRWGIWPLPMVPSSPPSALLGGNMQVPREETTFVPVVFEPIEVLSSFWLKTFYNSPGMGAGYGMPRFNDSRPFLLDFTRWLNHV